MKIPTFDECSEKDHARVPLDPLEWFVYENTPACEMTEPVFRMELCNALNFAVANAAAASIPATWTT